MKEVEELYLSIGQGNLMASFVVDMIVKGEKPSKTGGSIIESRKQC